MPIRFGYYNNNLAGCHISKGLFRGFRGGYLLDRRDLVMLQQSELLSFVDCLGAALYTQFAVDVVDMGFCGAQGDEQFFCNLPV